MLSALLASSMIALPSFMPAKAAQMSFGDVDESGWYYEAVKFVYDKGIMNGVDENIFSPNGSLTRAEFVTILCRMSGGEEKVTNSFTDVSPDAWYAGYVGWGADEGVVNGYEDKTFKPNAPMSRQEMAAALIRYIDASGINLPRENTAPYEFNDNDDIDEWAIDYVDVLRTSGISGGDDGVNYKPQSDISRAETATIIQRLYDIKEKAWQGYLPNAEKDEYAVYGANYLYWSGNYVQGGLGTDIITDSYKYPSLAAFADSRAAAQSYEPADSTGFSASASFTNIKEYPYMKICYSYIGADGHEKLTSYVSNRPGSEPSYAKHDLVLENAESDEGFMTAIADLSSAAAKFNDNCDGTTANNIHVMFEPFDGGQSENARFLIRYIAFFSDREAAEGFKSESLSDYLNDYFLYTNLFYEKATDSVTASYRQEILNRIKEIKNSPSSLTPEEIEASGGKCYYISSVNGNDSNSGESPDQAWKSIAAMYYQKGPVTLCHARKGDGVFFERGSVFYPLEYHNHIKSTLTAEIGVSYGAYGTGEKPLFLGSIDLGGGAGEWKETEWEDVYVFDQIDDGSHGENFIKEDADIGAIIINNGELMGVRVFPSDKEEPFGEGKTTKYMGQRGNCREYYISGGTSCENPGDALRNNLEFIDDYAEGKLYLRCEDGNPGECFDRIDIAAKTNIIYGAKDTRFDNIAVKYTSYVGISLGTGNTVVTNCEAGYCGGSETSVGTGIGGYGECDSIVIDNCYIHDVEDGSMGTQYTGEEVVHLDNVVCTNNVILTSQNLIELFGQSGVLDDEGREANKIRHARVTGNYAAYLGYGYPRSVGDGDVPGCECEGLGIHNWYMGEILDCVLENNVFFNCSGSITGTFIGTDSSGIRGWSLRNNTYILNPEVCSWMRTTDGIKYNMNFAGTFGYSQFLATYRIPYSYRYLAYTASLGIDPSGKYYYTDETTAAEKFGTFVMNGYHFENGD